MKLKHVSQAMPGHAGGDVIWDSGQERTGADVDSQGPRTHSGSRGLRVLGWVDKIHTVGLLFSPSG